MVSTRSSFALLALPIVIVLAGCATDPYGSPRPMTETEKGLGIGAASGAAAGAIIGSLSGDAGKGALIGAVESYFVADQVSPARLTSVGYGEARPIAPNDTEVGRTLNRRVEITIIPVVEDSASSA